MHSKAAMITSLHTTAARAKG